jgi:hypothetical protein
MKVLLPIALLTTAMTLTGCKEEASFDALESARATVNANAHYNASKFRAENGYSEMGLLVRGDSSQQPSCVQGDGWASVDLVDAKTKQPILKLKCSTVSPNIGCMTSDDFKSRTQYANQENACNQSLPLTPKKIEQ